jgi:glycosyltransferase involved in cell wall biosynthesis
MVKDKNITIIGSYPPPYGGCSVHVQRLYNELKKRNEVSVINFYSNNSNADTNIISRGGIVGLIKAFIFLASHRNDLIHIHVSSMNRFIYIGHLLLFFTNNDSKKILTIHSGSFIRFHKRLSSLKKKYFANTVLKKFDTVITVNLEQKIYINSIIDQEINIEVIPAFLPPVTVANKSIENKFLNIRENNKLILVTSGYCLEYYGFHLVIQAVKKLIRTYNNDLCLVSCFYNDYDLNYLETIESETLNNSDFVVYKDLSPEEFSFLLSLSDIYIRATDRDGDAVAIREAEYHGLEVIASDVVKRPEGVMLFKNLDANDLAIKLNELIKSVQAPKKKSVFNDNMSLLDELYCSLLNETDILNETNPTKP